MATTTVYDRRLLTTTGETTLLTAGGGGGIITQLVVANVTGTSATITVTIHDSGTNKIALMPGIVVDGNATVVMDLKQPLGAGKSVFATAGTSNALAVHTAGVNL